MLYSAVRTTELITICLYNFSVNISYIYSVSLSTQSDGLSPRDNAGGVTASGGENGFAHVQPYFPLRFLLQLIVSDHLVGMKMATFAHEIDPLSMENRYTA